MFDWFQANPKVFSNAILIIDDNAYATTIKMTKLFEQSGWQHIHQTMSAQTIENQKLFITGTSFRSLCSKP